MIHTKKILGYNPIKITYSINPKWEDSQYIHLDFKNLDDSFNIFKVISHILYMRWTEDSYSSDLVKVDNISNFDYKIDCDNEFYILKSDYIKMLMQLDLSGINYKIVDSTCYNVPDCVKATKNLITQDQLQKDYNNAPIETWDDGIDQEKMIDDLINSLNDMYYKE